MTWGQRGWSETRCPGLTEPAGMGELQHASLGEAFPGDLF